MKRTSALIALAMAVAATGVLVGVRVVGAQSATPPPAKMAKDLTVTVRHANGDVETYGDELTNLDLVVDEHGRLTFLHCVLISGEEKDTHVWYNMANLASVKYRFHTITGKSKVAVKRLKPLPVTPKPGVPRKVDELDVEDYK